MIDAPNIERQTFTKMAKKYFELGVFIEQAAAHQAQCVIRGLDCETPDGADQPWVSFIILPTGGQGCTRMKIERHIELLNGSPKSPVLR